MNCALAELYQPEMLTLAADGEKPDFNFDSAVFERAAEWIHAAGKFTPSMLREQPARAVINEVYRILETAVSSGLSVEMPDDLAAMLRNNTFVFSGFKAYHSLSELGLSLVGADGGIKPFAEFHKDVVRVDEKYNRNYLYAEYNHAMTSAQMASKWHDFESDGDRYDLQYRTADDDKVREEHVLLQNITLPLTDPFWKEFLPPNGWNCRCTTVQVRKGKYPLSDPAHSLALGEKVTASPKQQMFRDNPGISLTVFPEKHPYFKAAKEVKSEIKIKRLTRKDYAELNDNLLFSTSLRAVKNNYQDIARELDNYERAAVYYYSGNGYGYLNKHNRGEGKGEDWEKYKGFNNACSKALDNALFKKMTRYVGVCFRGTSLTSEQIAVYRLAFKNGKPVTEKHFLSTSYDTGSAFNGNVSYIIESKTGVKIEELSQHRGEKEVLFMRGTKFRVTNFEQKNNKFVITMEEI